MAELPPADAIPFHYEARVDVPVSLALAAAGGVSFLVPMSANRPLVEGPPLIGLDRATLEGLLDRPHGRVETAHHVSDVLLFAAIAAPAAWGGAEWGVGRAQGVDTSAAALAHGGITYEALAVSVALNQLFKGAVGRPRPYVYAYADDPERLAEFIGVGADGTVEADAYASFYSGHTATIAATSFSLAHMVAFGEERPGAARVLVPYAVATAATATMGALRVQAGRHFPTDVLVGGLVGAGIGIAVPELHRVGAGATATATAAGPPTIGFTLPI